MPLCSVHKGYIPGAIGRITALHADYYSRHAGFGLFFESRVATELAAFCRRYDESRDGLWLAVADGVAEGAIAIDGGDAVEPHAGAAYAGRQAAHLRWFITSDRIRGAGMGRALISAAVDFCKARNYPRIYLSTFEGLDAARHLYESFGFRLVHQQSGAQWGREVNEQRFELELAQLPPVSP